MIDADDEFRYAQLDILEVVQRKLAIINAQRNEIMEAFIAKHGFDADEAVQVVQRMRDGSEKFFIRKRTPEEMEMLNRLSSEL